MVAPLVAAAVGTAAANYYTGDQNRKANDKLAKQMRARLDGIALPELSEADYAYEGIDPRLINYDQYQYEGDYTPEMAQYAREIDPTFVERSENAKYGRDAQMEALRKFRSNIASGYDPEFAAKMDQASRQSQGDAQSRMASILQDSQRRGQFGSGAMLARQMQGASDALDRGSRDSQFAAVESYKNQLQQQRDAAGMGRQLAADEENFAAQNADIRNSFNQRASRSYQQYLTQQAEMRNQAQLRNLNTKQSIGNQNVDTRNRQTADQFKAQQAERAYKNQLNSQKQGVRQQNFGNQMAKATGQNAMGNMQMGMNNQGAMAQMGAIQGIGEGIAGYYANQEAADARSADRKWQGEQRELDRQAKYRTGGGY